jgi:hypothetical protein
MFRTEIGNNRDGTRIGRTQGQAGDKAQCHQGIGIMNECREQCQDAEAGSASNHHKSMTYAPGYRGQEQEAAEDAKKA